MDALNPVKTITESASRMALAMLSVCDECPMRSKELLSQSIQDIEMLRREAVSHLLRVWAAS